MEAFYFVFTIAIFAALSHIGYVLSRVVPQLSDTNRALWAIWREMKDQGEKHA